MESTWKSLTAGILTIVAGVVGISLGSLIASLGQFVKLYSWWVWFEVAGAFLIIMGVVALIGGIYSVRRVYWGFALAGAILAIICGGVLGILAVIFIVMGKNEFN